MAFSTSLIGDSGIARVAYNIDWSVGQIGSNLKVDVMLAQALLRILNYELLGFNADYDPPPGETGVIAVDGLMGPVTQRHITNFQRQAVSRGYKVMIDGIFDPFRKPGASSTISKSRYAMDLLNNACGNLCLKQGIDNYDRLATREDVPIELSNALKRVKTTANQYGPGQRVTAPTSGGA